MAMASAKAAARIMAVWILGAASGLRPMASVAREPIQPIAMAGAMVPTIIAPMVAKSLTASISIVLFFVWCLRPLFGDSLKRAYSIRINPFFQMLMVGLCGVPFLFVVRDGDSDENHGQHGKNQGLHCAHEHFQEQEG